MPSESYQPKPINTQGIVLPKELNDLSERLAENTHEIWARQRLDEGWTRGPQRDDHAKTHPSLVPYAQLPDSEKTYDRIMVTGLLKAMLALGYSISKTAPKG